MAIINSAQEFRIGRVVSRLFDALLANAVPFLALTALLTIPSLLLSLYTTTNVTQTMGVNAAGAIAPGGGVRFAEMGLAGMLVYLVFTFLLQAALTYGTISWLNGEKPSFGSSLSVAVKNFLPLIAIAILTGLGVTLGFVLLVVPGFILFLMWSVAVPVRVIEGAGITESFGRSRALTKGYRGRIFLLLLAYTLIAVAIGFAIRPLLGIAVMPKPGDLSPAYVLADWVVRVVLTSISSVGVTSIYYELRLVKEGIGAQQMAAAFD